MNLSTVRNIYNPIGKSKFNSLVRNPAVYKRTPKSIAKKTVDKVAKLIQTNRKVTREYLFKHLELSKTTTEAAVRVIFESGLLPHQKNYPSRELGCGESR